MDRRRPVGIYGRNYERENRYPASQRMQSPDTENGAEAFAARRTDEECPSDMQVLAMAYVPSQNFEALYSANAALCAGTLFRMLDKPWLGRDCR